MSNQVFPVLPGLAFGDTREPEWETMIDRSASQLESRAQYQSYPVYRITRVYEFLRAGAEAELQTLIGFFNQMGGNFDDFLIELDRDSSVTDQLFGTGDGTTTVFRLGRTLGGFYEPISATTGTVAIKINGVTQVSGYTLDANSGKVTFAAAPVNGATLSWSGSYLWRVRFEKGKSQFKQFLKDFWENKSVNLITVKTV